MASHSGIAIPMFMESCVVGVKEYGNRPRRFVDAINKIREISMRVQDRPCLLWIIIICFVISRINQIWRI